jgi:hypothetical protein
VVIFGTFVAGVRVVAEYRGGRQSVHGASSRNCDDCYPLRRWNRSRRAICRKLVADRTRHLEKREGRILMAKYGKKASSSVKRAVKK